MGGHARRRSTVGALPGSGMPSRGTMVHVKFPATSKIKGQLERKVILGRMTREQADKTLANAESIIRRSRTSIWKTVDEVGGSRARRDEEGQVTNDVPMGTFALPADSGAAARVIWSQAATAQRQLAAIGVGGIQYTAPAQYVSASGDGHVARVLSPEDSIRVGRRAGLWRKNLAMLSIDLPAKHPKRQAFYQGFNAITEAGAQVRRIGHSAYVGHPADVRRTQLMAQRLGIPFRS